MTVVVPSLGQVPSWPAGSVEGVAECVLVDDASDPPLVAPEGWRVVRRDVNGGQIAHAMSASHTLQVRPLRVKNDAREF